MVGIRAFRRPGPHCLRAAGAADYERALEDAISAAQEALDLIAAEGGLALTIEGAETEHIVWWTETRGIVLRDTAISDLGFSFSATAEVRDPAGNLVPQPAPSVPWHETFRYFRISEPTGDLFDTYRNLYLAVESLLSTVVPMRLNVAQERPTVAATASATARARREDSRT